jgi:hypothetical protein
MRAYSEFRDGAYCMSDETYIDERAMRSRATLSIRCDACVLPVKPSHVMLMPETRLSLNAKHHF